MKTTQLIKRFFYAAGVASLLSFLLFGQLTAVNAQSSLCDDSSDPAYSSAFCVAQRGDVDPIAGDDNIFKSIINFISWLVGVSSVIVLIIGGMRMVFSSGDSKTVASARGMIIYAVVGIAVVIFAQTIVAFVLNKL